MAAKLNQIIAIGTSTKTRVENELTAAHQALQKHDLFNGHSRKYTPRDADPTSPCGEQLPEENKRVSASAEAIIKETTSKLTELFDMTAIREWGNCAASADVVVDGKTLLTSVPVTYLLFLEKKLVDLHTFVLKLPTLDPSEEWSRNDAQDMFAAKSSSTSRTKKIVRPLVLYEATKEHPAQVKETTEDIFAGTWTATRYSTALQTSRRNEMLARVESLQKAVKFAREQANMLEVTDHPCGRTIFDYLFA